MITKVKKQIFYQFMQILKLFIQITYVLFSHYIKTSKPTCESEDQEHQSSLI